MKKIAIIYWPKKGSTEKVAHLLQDKLGKDNADVFTIKDITDEDFAYYGAFIIGAPTTGADNWEHAHKTAWHEFFAKILKADLKGKPYAIYGLGDGVRYPYHFVNGMIDIKKQFDKTEAKYCGAWPQKGYEFKESASIIDDKFVGLALDEDNEHELTDGRIDQWLKLIIKDFGK